MSYEAMEESVDSSSTLFLYEFIYDADAGLSYRYAASKKKEVVGGKVWKPFPIKHDEITSSGSLDKQSLTVTARMDIDLTPLFISGPPSRVIQLNIYRTHVGDSGIQMEWTGRVLNNKWAGGEVEFTCESIATSLVGYGLRRKYQWGCPHALYGTSCRASKLANTETGYVMSSESQLQVTVLLTSAEVGMALNTMIGGICRVTTSDGITEIRAIAGVTDNGGRQWALKLIAPIRGMVAGNKVSISKGCDHTFATCRDVFNNVLNFGGCPNIPAANPFTDNQF